MESAAVLRPINYSFSTKLHLRTVLEKPNVLFINQAAFSNLGKLPACCGELISSKYRHRYVVVSCSNTSAVSAKSNSNSNGAVRSGNQQNRLSEKKSPFNATFPNGLEVLLSEVCEETQIAELKVKLGAFEMHVKRNVDGPAVSAPFIPQIVASHEPSKPVEEMSAAAPPPPPKSSAEKPGPFTNVSAETAAKIATLEASGSSNYVIVPSSKVGLFRRARTNKGKRQSPACKEGDLIKEGQVIGYMEQLNTEIPIESEIAGKVLKVLSDDGEAVGYGDPLVAVSPSS